MRSPALTRSPCLTGSSEMTPPTREASTARLSASVWPEMRMARECCTRGGVMTATVRTILAGAASGALASPSFWALPTDENSPVATQRGEPGEHEQGDQLVEPEPSHPILSTARVAARPQ